jgi:hypothetical protein
VAVRERWTVDGYELTEGDIRDVEYRSGQLGTPATRGENATIAHRTGRLWRPKVHDTGAFTLDIWFGTNQRQAQAQWDEILRAVVQPHRLCAWSRVTPSGEVRHCEGEVTAALQPTAIGQSAYRASIEVSVPAGYWRGDRQFTVSTPTTGTPGVDGAGRRYREVELTPFASSTAPLEALTLQLRGAVSAPTVTDVSGLGRGESLRYGLAIPDQATITLDCGSWEGRASGTSWEPEVLSYTGHRFLTVAATPPGVTPTLRLSASTMGAGAQLTVSGYRSYLC